MKSVLISIKPKWVEKIVSGEKTMEVRKTRPKLETPFKCYIYCTSRKSNGEFWFAKKDTLIQPVDSVQFTGKVIGEFVCGEIIKDERGEYADVFVKQACLSLEEQKAYGGDKPLYGWHISDLKIYDKPKELSEFNRPCVSVLGDCEDCICGKTSYSWDFDEKTGKIYCTRRLSKAPQSWCYVEEKE